MPARLNNTKFVKRAKAVHGEAYDYSLVDYQHTDLHVEILCKEHGSFFQTPHKHLLGKGCPLCKNKIMGAYRIKNTEWFVDKAKQVHGDKYDYSNTEYHRYMEHLEIICPIHGKFSQTPSNHLNGFGCKYCGRDRASSVAKGGYTEYALRTGAYSGDERVYMYHVILQSRNNSNDFIEKVGITIFHNVKERFKCTKHYKFYKTVQWLELSLREAIDLEDLIIEDCGAKHFGKRFNGYTEVVKSYYNYK